MGLLSSGKLYTEVAAELLRQKLLPKVIESQC
jgi:hypothetical protein